MEIRVPHTRLRLWIGKFRHCLEAALAYDAAMFCFYDHGRSCAAFLAPLLCRVAPRELSTQPLMAMVPRTDDPDTTAGADEAALADGHHGDNENMFLSCLCDE
ncbi:hypothetical protein SORBI_3009G145200 [Sorghum bicolor]|uniref:AP2/ERF domain-containing protein n=1 Tax=Sorghum bicolor TaxID=4558 RepID=A0A1Z5R2R1_SORBI|nr:hypothetical protein SORBI_3009G145200 [Sorghum bicolor]OQU78050.1 hypothetical protein SORBI_3009G145200 [Sorghum bicolor]